MSNYTIFNLENIDNNDISNNNTKKLNDIRIDIDELFEKKKEQGLREYNLFTKLLNRIHIKIKLTSKQKINEQFIWFIVPEIIIGYPKYDISSCIIFLIDNLKKNNFLVKYYHPNTLFIYWGHYYPSYVRDEVKNKFGIKVDEFGRKINETDDLEIGNDNKKLDLNYNNTFFKENENVKSNNNNKKKENNKNKYTDIKSYNPTGNLFYNELLNPSSRK